MKKIFTAFIFSGFLFLCNLHAQVPDSPAFSIPVSTQNVNIAVIDFTGKNVSAADASIVTDFIRTQMVNLNIFHVMDRNNMETVLAEQKFQASGCTETECAVQIGKILNVHKMAVGSVSKLEGIYYITALMIDVETGKIETSKTNQCYNASELKTSAEDLANQLVGIKTAGVKAEYPATRKEERPRIINVQGDKLTINKGLYDRIEKRQIFDIYSESKKIAYLQITDIAIEESTGKIIRRYGTDLPKNGDFAIYAGRKFKTGGIGLTGGYVSGKYKGWEGWNREWGWGGIYYEFVGPSGWGFQLNLTNYFQGEYDFSTQLLPGPQLWKDSEARSWYSFPVLFKYHLFYDTDFSPYVGFGLYYNSTRSRYSEYNTQTGTSTLLWVERNVGISLVLNAGFELWTKKFCHFSGDVKFFLGKSTPHFNSNAFVISPAVSFHW